MIKNESSFIVLYTDKISQTKSFFQALKCEILEFEEDKCVVRFGTHELHYVTSEPIESYAFISKKKSESKGLILYVEVDELSHYPKQIEQFGGQVLSDVVITPWETSEFLFNDPNGYHFVMYQV